MGGLVTKVKIGAFEMTLEPQYDDQRLAAERLAELDAKGNRDGVFSPADVGGGQNVATAYAAEAMHPGDQDFFERLHSLVQLTNLAAAIEPTRQKIRAHYTREASTGCVASPALWRELGGRDGLLAFQQQLTPLRTARFRVRQLFPEGHQVKCQNYGQYGRTCWLEYSGHSVYGSLREPLHRAHTAFELIDDLVENVCDDISCEGDSCSEAEQRGVWFPDMDGWRNTD